MFSERRRLMTEVNMATTTPLTTTFVLLMMLMVGSHAHMRMENPPENWFTTEKCGNYYYKDSGTISSPNYPNPYPANFYCYYNIYLGGSYFYLTITDKDIQSDDSLIIYNRNYNQVNLAPYSQLYDNYVYIYFYTNGINQGRGFQIHWNRYSPVFQSPWAPDPNVVLPICKTDSSFDNHLEFIYRTVPLTNTSSIALLGANDQNPEQTEIPPWWYTDAPSGSTEDPVTQDPYQQYFITTIGPNPNCGGVFNATAGEFIHDFDSEDFSHLTNEICEYTIFSDVRLRLLVDHVGNRSSGVIKVSSYIDYNQEVYDHYASTYNYTTPSHLLWAPLAFMRGVGSLELCGYAFKVQVLNPRQLTNSSAYRVVWYPEELDGIKVRCDENFYQVEVNRTVLEEIYPGVNITDLRLNEDDDSCRAKTFGDIVVFQSSLTGCGMERTESLSHYVYGNVIISEGSSTNGEITTSAYYNYNYNYNNPLITRETETGLGLEVHCRVNRVQHASSKYIPLRKTSHIASGFGEFTLDMDFYWDSAYTSRIFNYPLFIDLNKDLYVQVSLRSDDPDLRIVLDQCLAVNTANLYGLAYGSKQHGLVSQGCGVDATILSSNATDERFSFRTFRFLNTNFNDVYVVCFVTLCNSTDTTNCQTGCRTQRMYKREAQDNGRDRNFRIQQGPIRLPQELGLAAGGMKTGVVSPVMTLMTAAMMFLFWRL